MNTTLTRWTMLLTLLALLAPTATLAEEPAEKKLVDEISQTAFENWAKMHYTAATLGADKGNVNKIFTLSGLFVGAKHNGKGREIWYRYK